MNSLDKTDIQRALVNVTKSERAGVTFEPDYADIPWERLDFYGWRDRKRAHRGYLVRQRAGDLVAVAVQTPETGMSANRKAMCAICAAVDSANAIALFAARRTGPAGRKGDTVGTYICAGLDCSAQLRMPTHKVGRTVLGSRDLTADELAADMLARLDAFVASVCG